MQWIPVHSGRIDALAYDEDEFTCYVRFRAQAADPEGDTFAYANVSPEMFHDWQTAPSALAYLLENLDGNPDHPSRRTASQASTASTAKSQAEAGFSNFEDAVETAIALARKASAFEIATPEAYQQAGEDLLQLAAERRRRVEYFRPMKEAAFAAHRAICARENEALAPLRAAEAMLQAGLIAYRRNEERQRRERQRLLNAQHDLALQQDAARCSSESAAMPDTDLELRPAGDHNTTLAGRVLASTHGYAPLTVAQENLPEVDGLSFARDWTFEVEDETKVPLSHEWYSLDPKKIRAYVKRMKQHASIPGVRVYPVERSRKRAA